MPQDNFTKHTLLLENRQLLEITGIVAVDSFNEEEIIADCSDSQLIIKGENLHIEVLDLTSGDLKVNGSITALVYNEKREIKSFFKKVFAQ